MECKSYNNNIRMIEGFLKVNLLPHQKEMIKIHLCGSCNILNCKERVNHISYTKLNEMYVIPRRVNHRINMRMLYDIMQYTVTPPPINVKR